MKFASQLSLALIAILICVPTVNAAVVLSDTFSYVDGSLVGATGSPWTTQSGTSGQQQVVSGKLLNNDADSEDTRAEFLGTTSDTGFTSGILTAEFELRIDSSDPPSSSAGGKYIAHFIGDFDAADTPATFFGRVFVNAGDDTDFKLGLTNFSSAFADTSFFGSELKADTDYSLTLTFDIDNGTSSLSVAGLGTINATDAAAIPARMNAFGFRQTTTTGDRSIDNLSVTLVPEPSTAALCCLGAMGWVARRRRS